MSNRYSANATFGGGMNKDVDPVQLPQGDYIFALNAQTGSTEGESGVLSNELANKIAGYIPADFIIIGHCYLRDGKIVLFLLNPDAENYTSQIGIFDIRGKYTVHVDFPGLNFSVENPIEAIFRVRKGCERTIYWTEKNNGNPPRYYVFEKPNQFKTEDGRWDERQFLLQKSYKRPPAITHLFVLNGGTLEAGSYSVAIQLIDENLNKSEWISSTGRINIYHSDVGSHYPHIEGSVNSTNPPLGFGRTNKAIEIKLADLDKSFKYYRLAFIRSISNNGRITDIRVTGEIDISIDRFIYNGNNTVGTISHAELLAENNLYDGAETIEQMDNRLILGNVKRPNINWCRLQYYASRITADCITKRISLNSVWDSSNPKNPVVDLGNTGYMPGEIYSFGIVYVFEGGIKSPVYHIPGKPKYVDRNMIFNGGRNVYPMSNDNICDSKYYTSPTTGFNYWGNDSQGKPLEGNVVRHHRFPRRDEIGLPLVNIDRDNRMVNYRSLKLIINGNIDFSYVKPIVFRLKYKHNQQQAQLSTRIIPASYDNRQNLQASTIRNINAEIRGKAIIGQEQGVYEDIELSYAIGNSNYVKIEQNFSYNSRASITLRAGSKDDPNILQDYEGFKGVTISFSEHVDQTYAGRKKVTTDILGIKFGNIDMPLPQDTNGYKCIGYYIVRNHRTNEEKTVIDTGIIFPTTNHEKYVAFGVPNYQSNNNANHHDSPWATYWSTLPGGVHFLTREYDRMFALYYPLMEFADVKINDITRIRQIGSLRRINDKYGLVLFQDVADGSSLPQDKITDFDKGNDDYVDGKNPHVKDGYCCAIYSRDRDVHYEVYRNGYIFHKRDIHNIYYMPPMGHVTSRGKEVYNLAANKKICLIEPNGGLNLFGGNNADYNDQGVWQWPRPMFVQIERDNKSPYYKFDATPYYSDVLNMIEFTKKENDYTVVFGGDSYVSPMRDVWLSFNVAHNALRIKDGWKAFWKMMAAAILVVAGIVGAVFSGGSSLVLLGLGLSLAGVGLLVLRSGIDTWKTQQIWREEYDKGLRQCVNDRYFGSMMSRTWTQSDYFEMSKFPDGRNQIKYKKNDDGTPDKSQVLLTLGTNGFSDDTFVWNADAISDLYFESSINISLRNRFANDPTPTFMHCPSEDGDPNKDKLGWWGIENFNNSAAYLDAQHSRYERNDLEKYCVSCLMGYDGRRQDHKSYLGIPLPTYSYVNPDYMTKHKLKAYFTIPRDYDCASDCKNSFPNRIIWSEISREEESADGYRSILANNYVDMDASAGNVTKIIRYNNQLYTFTSESVWMFPNTLQERVNNGVVTYIGTGEFLSVPPRRIVDSNTGLGGGCVHSFSVIKTPYGLCYVSYTDRKIYLLQGNQLKPLSSAAMFNWFKKNIEIFNDEQYIKNNDSKYKYSNNTFNKFGSGFALGFDNYNNRLLVTKKDNFTIEKKNFGYVIITDGVDRYIFKNYQETIDRYKKEGWEFLGATAKNPNEGGTNSQSGTDVIDKSSTIPNLRFRRFVSKDGTKKVKVRRQKTITKIVKVPKKVLLQPDYLLIRYRAEGSNADFNINTKTNLFNPILTNSFVDIHSKYSIANYQNISPDSIYWEYGVDPIVHNRGTDGVYEDIFIINMKKYRESNPNVLSLLMDKLVYWEIFTDRLEPPDPAQVGNKGYSVNNDAGIRITIKLEMYRGGEIRLEEGRGKANTTKPYKTIKILNANNFGQVLIYQEDVNVVYNKAFNIDRTSTIESIEITRNIQNFQGKTFTKNYTINSKPEVIKLNDISEDDYDSELEKKREQHRQDLIAIAKEKGIEIDEEATVGNLTGILSIEDTTEMDFTKENFLKSESISYEIDEGKVRNTESGVIIGKDETKEITVMEDKKIEEVKEYFDEEIVDSSKLKPDFLSIPPIPYEDRITNNSWTLSYSFNNNRWISFHSYLPNGYITTADKMFTFIDEDQNIYHHNPKGFYNNYYSKKYPHIIEFVCKTQDLNVVLFDSLSLSTDALKFQEDLYHDSRFITFNKAVLYNGRQCSGLLLLTPKKDNISNYIQNISSNSGFDTSYIDRREKDWNINEFYDIRSNYDTYIWSDDLGDRQGGYYIDKVLNFRSLSYDKHWTQLERFRDRYIIIRLIFDNHTDVKLLTRICKANIII